MARFYLVIDFEATCSEDGSVPREEMEILEIGAVLTEAPAFKPLSEFQAFIRPQRHPILTDFCKRLTGISQAEADTAEPFPTVLQKLRTWLEPYKSFEFCSWGNYDQNQLKQDCRFHKVGYPFTSHLNLKEKFSARHRLNKKPGMAEALRIAKLPLIGRHHRGIDDARNIARLLPSVFG